jgi:hypothetical protein
MLSLALVFKNRLAQIRGISLNELRVYTPDFAVAANNSEDLPGNGYGNGRIKIYEESVEVFQKGHTFPGSYEDSLAAIQLLNFFDRADQTQRRVNLSTAGNSSPLGRLDNEVPDVYRTRLPGIT